MFLCVNFVVNNILLCRLQITNIYLIDKIANVIQDINFRKALKFVWLFSVAKNGTVSFIWALYTHENGSTSKT